MDETISAILAESRFNYGDLMHLLINFDAAQEGVPIYDGNFTATLSSDESRLLGLDRQLKCQVIGDADRGVAFLFRSRNPLKRGYTAFYTQPSHDPRNPEQFDVWKTKAPAHSLQKHEVYWGFDFLKSELTELVTHEQAATFVKIIQRNLDDKKQA